MEGIHSEMNGKGETNVIAANMPWYRQNRISGILELPTLGWPRTFIKPKLLRSPM